MTGWRMLLRGFLLGLMLSVAVILPRPVTAFSVEELLDPFDASTLSWQERRFLQAALAFTGDYSGLLDGDWGSGSQRALERFTRRVDETMRPRNWVVVMLAFETLNLLEAEGWHQEWYAPMGMSVLVPSNNLAAGRPSDNFVNFEHLGSSLSYSLRISGARDMVQMHEFTEGRATGQPYMVRRDDRWITSSSDAAGVTLYTRSDLLNGAWSTIMLSAGPPDGPVLNAVAASISPDRSAQLDLPANGRIATGILNLAGIMESDGESDGASGPEVASDRPRSQAEDSRAASSAPQNRSSGTGFFVSAAGHVLTNAHVVAGCATISVDGQPATVIAQDSSFDLALLQSGQRPSEYAVFASSPAQLNSDISVAGYPLRQFLSDLNVTRGSITAIRGLAGDITRMQISAPVQPGNSGGPVLSARGTVVGVVVSKLDAGRVAELTGDIPQNINFAVRGEMAQFFMKQNGVNPVIASGLENLMPEQLADRAAAITRLIECG